MEQAQPIEPQSESDAGEMREDPADFLESYGDYLYGYAFVRLKDVQKAEDVVQETLLKAFRHYDRFRGDSKVRTWLTSILRNEIASVVRKANRKGEFQLVGEEENLEMGELLHPRVSNSEFELAVEKDEFWAVIKGCYGQVPKHLLQVFLAKSDSEGKSTKEICKNLGITPSNFAVRMFRTRLLLRKCVEEKWLDDRL